VSTTWQHTKHRKIVGPEKRRKADISSGGTTVKGGGEKRKCNPGKTLLAVVDATGAGGGAECYKKSKRGREPKGKAAEGDGGVTWEKKFAEKNQITGDQNG